MTDYIIPSVLVHLDKLRGRPTEYTPEKASLVCNLLAQGIPLSQICKDNIDLPHPSIIRDWCEKNKELSLAIAHAREDGEDCIAGETRKIARGEPGYSTGDVIRDKLIIDTDLKLLAKWNPKKYGDKQQIDHTGTLTLSQLVEQSYKTVDSTATNVIEDKSQS